MSTDGATDTARGSAEAARALARARARLEAQLRAGQAGSTLTADYSAAVEAIVTAIARAPIARAEARFGPMAVAAVGGLGRRELGPHSDVNLVLVSPSAPPEGHAEFDALVRDLVHPLWDAGMRAAVMVHDPATWLAEAADNLTLCTALLDLRCLVGTARVIDDLRDAAFDRFFGEHRGPFLERLDEEVAERHARYGGTVFLVEPDTQVRPGGRAQSRRPRVDPDGHPSHRRPRRSGRAGGAPPTDGFAARGLARRVAAPAGRAAPGGQALAGPPGLSVSGGLASAARVARAGAASRRGAGAGDRAGDAGVLPGRP